MSQKVDEKKKISSTHFTVTYIVLFFNPILQMVFTPNILNEINSITMTILQPFAHAPAKSY